MWGSYVDNDPKHMFSKLLQKCVKEVIEWIRQRLQSKRKRVARNEEVCGMEEAQKKKKPT